MSKMYTFDDKLLVGGPEIRIGDKVYPIDDRKKTVKKLLKDIKKNEKTDDDVIGLPLCYIVVPSLLV